MAGDYSFQFTNLNPLNSGWSAASLAKTLVQPKPLPQAALDAQNASLYGHVNKNKKGGGSGGSGASSAALALAGTAVGGPVGGVVGGTLGKVAGGLFGGDDKPRTPAQITHHVTSKILKHNVKQEQQAEKVTAHQHTLDALTQALNAATDPKVREQLGKQLEKEQKQFSKEQVKYNTGAAHIDALKAKVMAVNPPPPGAQANNLVQKNYFDELVDKTLASRQGVSGWHTEFGVQPTGTATSQTAQANPTTNPNLPNAVQAPTIPLDTVLSKTPDATTGADVSLTRQQQKWRDRFNPKGWMNLNTAVTPANRVTGNNSGWA